MVSLALATIVGCAEPTDRSTPPFQQAATTGRCTPGDSGMAGVLWGEVSRGDTLALEGAQIFLPELGVCGTLADSLGRYVLTGVPPGEHTLVFQLLGYRTDSMTITVADDTVWAPADLEAMAVKIDDMIVKPMGATDTLPEARRR